MVKEKKTRGGHENVKDKRARGGWGTPAQTSIPATPHGKRADQAGHPPHGGRRRGSRKQEVSCQRWKGLPRHRGQVETSRVTRISGKWTKVVYAVRDEVKKRGEKKADGKDTKDEKD